MWRHCRTSPFYALLAGIGDAERHKPAEATASPKPERALPPQGSPGSAAILTQIYSRSLDRINADLAKALEKTGGSIEVDKRGVLTGANFRAARAASLKVSVERELRKLQAQSGPIVRQAAEQAVTLGVRQGAEEVRRLGLSGPGVGFALGEFDRRAVELVAADMQSRLLGAAADHAQRAQSVFRAVSGGSLVGRDNDISGVVASAIVTGDFESAGREMRQLINQAYGGDAADSIRKIGRKQIEVGGWSGSIAAYADMLLLTRTREATVTARHGRLTQNGIGLVQITGRRSPNFCTRYLGMVFALAPEYQVVNGKTYPLLSSLEKKGPPFHPRCSKGTAAFIPELVSSARVAAAEEANKLYQQAVESNRTLASLTVSEQKAYGVVQQPSKKAVAKAAAARPRRVKNPGDDDLVQVQKATGFYAGDLSRSELIRPPSQT